MATIYAHPTTLTRPHTLAALQLATGRIAIPNGDTVHLVTHFQATHSQPPRSTRHAR